MTRVFIISLEENSKLLDKTKLLLGQGFKVVMHQAFDGRKLIVPKSQNTNISPLSRGPLNGGEFGCAKSHNQVWERIKSKKLGSAVVLEEDWLTTSFFDLKALTDLVEFVKDQEQPTLVYLGCHYTGIKPFKFVVRAYWILLSLAKSLVSKDGFWTHPLNYNIQNRGRSQIVRGLKAGESSLFTSGLPHGTYGYVVNKQAATKLLELNETCTYRSDETLNLAEMVGHVTMFKPEHPLISWDKSRTSTVQQVQSS